MLDGWLGSSTSSDLAMDKALLRLLYMPAERKLQTFHIQLQPGIVCDFFSFLVSFSPLLEAVYRASDGKLFSSSFSTFEVVPYRFTYWSVPKRPKSWALFETWRQLRQPMRNTLTSYISMSLFSSLYFYRCFLPWLSRGEKSGLSYQTVEAAIFTWASTLVKQQVASFKSHSHWQLLLVIKVTPQVGTYMQIMSRARKNSI